MKSSYAGVWPAVLTPITDDGKLALGPLEQMVDLYARQKLGGLYVGGSTGQWPLLTPDERRAVAECSVRVSAKRIPVMIHVGTATTADAVALARQAEEVGADAVSTIAPIYYGHPPDAVFHHYQQIGQATKLPLYVYHLSGVHQLTLGPRQYAERLLSIPNIAGMKITDHDLYSFGLLNTFTQGRLCLLSGADEVMCHAVLSGAAGAIGTFYNVWGVECQAVRAAFAAGNVGLGRDFMLAFQAAIHEVLSRGSWSFLRAAMRMKHGIDVGMPRAPLGIVDKPWPDADVQRVLRQVETAARGA